VNASVPYFSLGGTSTGPGMGQYVPVADLNAQKKKRPKLRRVKQDPDIKDSPGTEPAKYYAKDAAGKKMAKSTKQARDRHFTKGAKMDDDNPDAYKPAPGDKGAKTKPSKYTLKYKKMFGEEPRIPRKKGQPAGSDKHSDLYTDENPKGTIHGLGFKDVATAKASVSKIEKSNRTHAHKIQAAIAMEQRARVMGKTAEANVYRAYIEKMKKKTKEMRKEVSEALKLKLSYPKNNPDMMVLKVRDTNQRGHVEVRGKKGYETKHNKRDKLHKFLDQLDGPTVSTLLGTEDEITLNPKNPDRKQTIKVVNDLVQKNEDGHTALAKTNAAQKKELERLKIQHDREDDRARSQDTARKNQQTEGLWDNIRKKRERIKRGSGEKMRKPGEKGAPTPAQIKRAQEDKHGFDCPAGYKFDSKLMVCVPKKTRFKDIYTRTYFFPTKSDAPAQDSQDSQNQNGQSGNGNGNGNGNGQNGNGGNGNGGNGASGGNGGNAGGESYLAADVRKMPGGGYGVYADKFVKGKRVTLPSGKHQKELKKVYRSKEKANKYMAAIMIGKGG
tara:strand:+ start:1570 stop:3234 length:1665 start_codon:yes stop_codon:yes gene_type:complete